MQNLSSPVNHILQVPLNAREKVLDLIFVDPEVGACLRQAGQRPFVKAGQTQDEEPDEGQDPGQKEDPMDGFFEPEDPSTTGTNHELDPEDDDHDSNEYKEVDLEFDRTKPYTTLQWFEFILGGSIALLVWLILMNVIFGQ